MSRRRAQSAPTVTLFPFLAVLVCAMGSLILLLLVVTRQIRSEAVAALSPPQPVAESVLLAEDFLPEMPADRLIEEVLPDFTPELPVIIPETSEPPAEMETELAELQGSVEPEVIEPEPVYPEALAYHPQRDGENAEYREKKRQQAMLADSQQQLTRTLALADQTEQALNARRAELQQTQQELTKEELKLKQLLQSTQANSAELQQLQDKIQALQAMLQTRTEEITSAEEEQQNRKDKLQIVTFDGASGIKRQPVFIECKAGEVVFHPENVAISLMDLEDYPADANPLVYAVRALVEYRAEQKQQPPQPYALIIGRPHGIKEFYGCGQILGSNQIPFGYELIGQNQQLYFGKADPEAARILLEAIQLAKQQGPMPQSRFAKMNSQAEERRLLPRLQRSNTAGGNGTAAASGKPGSPLGAFPELPPEPRGGRLIPDSGRNSREFAGGNPAGRAMPAESKSSPPFSGSSGSASGGPSDSVGQVPSETSRQNLTRSLAELSGQPAAQGFPVPPAPLDGRSKQSEQYKQGGQHEQRGQHRPVEHYQNGSVGQFPAAAMSDSSGWTAANSTEVDPAQLREISRRASSGTSGAATAGGGQANGGRASSGRQRPGESPPQRSGSIRLERQIIVKVSPQGLQLGQQRLIPWQESMSQEMLAQLFWRLTQQEVSRFESPPEGIVWAPAFHFHVSPGAELQAYRLETLARQEQFPVTSEIRWGASFPERDLFGE